MEDEKAGPPKAMCNVIALSEEEAERKLFALTKFHNKLEHREKSRPCRHPGTQFGCSSGDENPRFANTSGSCAPPHRYDQSPRG